MTSRNVKALLRRIESFAYAGLPWAYSIGTSQSEIRFMQPLETIMWMWYLMRMPLSARNQLAAKVSSIELGDIMAHVVVRIGKANIESLITP